jgi:hypothetical protein
MDLRRLVPRIPLAGAPPSLGVAKSINHSKSESVAGFRPATLTGSCMSAFPW